MKKLYELDPEHIEILDKLMKRKGFKREVQALRYILTEFDQQELRVKELSFQMDLNVKILKDMEKKIDVLYDAVNTVLIDSGITICKPVDIMESDVYRTSTEYRKERLAKLKQRKDFRNGKGAKFSTRTI